MKAVVAAATFAALQFPLAGSAQTGQSAPLPSYATPAQESIRGRISGFEGKNVVYVRDERGFTDKVTLRQGTVINPTGIRLATGQSVTVYGRASGDAFAADEIDTPYRQRYAYGYPAFYPAYYPYPVYARFGFYGRF